AGHIRVGSRKVGQVQGDDRVSDVERAAWVGAESAAVLGEVLGNRAVEKGGMAGADAAAVGVSCVASDGGVRQVRRGGVDAAAAVTGGIAADRTVGERRSRGRDATTRVGDVAADRA